MKAVAYTQAGALDRADALIDIELKKPTLGPQDLLIKVAAISVNPVDAKIRSKRPATVDEPQVIGWDAVGEVVAVGAKVQDFAVGDRVFYAGALDRPGSNAEYQLVDARIVGHAPESLSDAEAAALPLTAITAWELLFDRLGVAEGGGAGQTLLVIGAAGGVGSILVQLARQLTELTVVGTAAREESAEWAKELGAHHVIDHGKPMLAQLQALGIESVELIASLTHTKDHYAQYIECIAPQGKLGVIDDFDSIDITQLKSKSASFHWEFMFARAMHKTSDMIEQHNLLTYVANEIDAGRIRTTVSDVLSPISAANMRKAHAMIETGSAKGKIVVEGF